MLTMPWSWAERQFIQFLLCDVQFLADLLLRIGLRMEMLFNKKDAFSQRHSEFLLHITQSLQFSPVLSFLFGQKLSCQSALSYSDVKMICGSFVHFHTTVGNDKDPTLGNLHISSSYWVELHKFGLEKLSYNLIDIMQCIRFELSNAQPFLWGQEMKWTDPCLLLLFRCISHISGKFLPIQAEKHQSLHLQFQVTLNLNSICYLVLLVFEYQVSNWGSFILKQLSISLSIALTESKNIVRIARTHLRQLQPKCQSGGKSRRTHKSTGAWQACTWRHCSIHEDVQTSTLTFPTSF